ncbi:MAG TPA: hypothetical protein VFZ81_13265 [Burkholderiales bacterium]
MKPWLAWTLTFVALIACTEEPQQLDAADRPGYRTDDWQDQQRERTLRQSESTRIY